MVSQAEEQPPALLRYDWTKSYRWNYEHAPSEAQIQQVQRWVEASGSLAHFPGQWDFLGLPVGSPLGIAAGPLLNGQWCRYYAELGFDVVTYKTVRSRPRECYPMPNLQPVDVTQMTGSESRVKPVQAMQGTWAVSFGMPSRDPELWRRDVERTRTALPGDKLLSLSVVGTIEAGWDLSRLAEDYADCARWGVESGADCIEANFSCPNVETCDGQLYQNPEASRLVATVIRQAIGRTPLVVKIGFVPDPLAIAPLVQALAGVVDGLSMTNSIAARVGEGDDALMFDGQPRGICGDAIADGSANQVRQFSDVIDRSGAGIKLIGVGGIHSARVVQAYVDAGAHACHLATAVMVDPGIGLAIRRALA